MHSFHQSRGRIFFDIFCALTIGVSCAIAWLQTGASALLAIAGVAAAYSLVRATDAGQRIQRVAAEGPDLGPAADMQGDLLAYVAPAAKPVVEEVPKPAKAKRPSRKKKGDPVAAEPAVAELEEVAVEPAIAEPEDVAAIVEGPAIVEAEEEHHAIVTPLFEPQPMVRQQRTVFGRKAG